MTDFYHYVLWASLVAQTVKHSPTMQETHICSLDREDPLEREMAVQYPCLDSPRHRGAWRATVHGAAKSRTGLSD